MSINNENNENIIISDYSSLMRQSYIDYAMSVIISRAIPDVRDGLKPVQRRTLFDMYELGLTSDKPYKKCARVVGDTMGKYHPHGDSSIYESLVIMAQSFKKGMTMVDGHGNFGSIEGDGAAAMRYTECRLQKISEEALLTDLDKDVVDFVSNFDDSLLEPSVLPCRLPNILINGAEGIAVGMVTSIPPHNISESIDALIYSIKNENIDLDSLMDLLKGPDFPTGGSIVNKSELRGIYENGTGRIRLRGTATIEEIKGKMQIVISEIPYTMIGAGINKFLVDIENLIDAKKLNDIVNISNMSSKDGIRIVIELKKGADAQGILNLIYSKTKLEDTLSVNMLTVSGGKPKVMGLIDILKEVGNFQTDIFTRKYNTLLKKEQSKKEVQEGLLKAIDVIDVIIAVLRGAKTVSDVKTCLTTGDTEKIKFRSKEYEEIAKSFDFTEKQAVAILEMRMQKLIGLELYALRKEYEKTVKNIEEYTAVLSDKEKLKAKIIQELNRLKKLFGKERCTKIVDSEAIVVSKIDAVEQDITVLVDKMFYIRAVDRVVYDRNRATLDEDNIFILNIKNTDKICIFTDKAKLYLIKASDLSIGKLKDKGIPLDNISGIDTVSEKIVYFTNFENLKNKELLFVTEKSMIKIVQGLEFDVASKKSIVSTKLLEDDRLVCVLEINEETNVVLKTVGGIYLRFRLSEVSKMKKNSVGVRGMKLEKGDCINNAELFIPIENSSTELNSFPLFRNMSENIEDETDETDKKIKFYSSLRLARRDTKGSRVND